MSNGSGRRLAGDDDRECEHSGFSVDPVGGDENSTRGYSLSFWVPLRPRWQSEVSTKDVDVGGDGVKFVGGLELGGDPRPGLGDVNFDAISPFLGFCWRVGGRR